MPFTTGVVDSGALGTDLKTTVTLDATATTRAFTADSTTELYIYGDKGDGTTVINTSCLCRCKRYEDDLWLNRGFPVGWF